AILVRMPEIGRVTRQEVAALAGLAPYDNDSCSQIGARHIKGGRKRIRGRLYSAALPASFRWNAQLIALYQRLIAKGKSHKTALIACDRTLLICENAVSARGAHGTKKPTPPPHIGEMGGRRRPVCLEEKRGGRAWCQGRLPRRKGVNRPLTSGPPPNTKVQ